MKWVVVILVQIECLKGDCVLDLMCEYINEHNLVYVE